MLLQHGALTPKQRVLIEKNFTLYTKRWTSGKGGYKPLWLCNDATGKCKGNRRWAQTYPAGTLHPKWVETWIDNGIIQGYWKYDFIWDEKGGPCMNDEVIYHCHFCEPKPQKNATLIGALKSLL
jgi:hypothetical protein